ncbi:MAG TPA: pyrimidine dimer DNA glycosylase/endonuclease V [Verrucomicrobiae bacterium]|nr:pyrimidine dimer DNA glycosylase/endonuclease V [Verrucomicrobiae bacterium]
MRLWTLHPRYLDPKGLVACWREGLLAQKVLSRATRGYRNHPQLLRFRSARDPMSAIAAFLHEIASEAERRGYKFDVRKIEGRPRAQRIRETRGQLEYEWAHLTGKLKARAPGIARRLREVERPQAHPLFRIIGGKVREWEKQRKEARGLRRDGRRERG